jgi:FixJ family two-component response regulator
MPKMGGPELVERLQEQNVQIKVLYTSGFSDSRALEDGLGSGAARLLRKPYDQRALAHCVRETLDAA